MSLPIWLIAATVLIGILLTGPTASRLNDPPRRWTAEDELDWRENNPTSDASGRDF